MEWWARNWRDRANYSTDADSTGPGDPRQAGGRGRTVVKVPLGQVSRPITLLRLRVLGASPVPAPSLAVHGLRVLQYVRGRIVVRRTPPRGWCEAMKPPPAGFNTPTISAFPIAS